MVPCNCLCPSNFEGIVVHVAAGSSCDAYEAYIYREGYLGSTSPSVDAIPKLLQKIDGLSFYKK
jgi:hypothetical protein